MLPEAETAWLHLLSRGDEWTRYTFLFHAQSPFGSLGWSEAQCRAAIRAMVDAGLLESRRMRTTGGRSGLAKVGGRTEYRVRPAVRAAIGDRLVRLPSTAPTSPVRAADDASRTTITGVSNMFHVKQSDQAAAQLPADSPESWRAYIAERYGEAAARSLDP